MFPVVVMLSASMFAFALFKTIQLPYDPDVHFRKSRRRSSRRYHKKKVPQFVSVAQYLGCNPVQEWCITGGYLMFVGVMCRFCI